MREFKSIQVIRSMEHKYTLFDVEFDVLLSCFKHKHKLMENDFGKILKKKNKLFLMNDGTFY